MNESCTVSRRLKPEHRQTRASIRAAVHKQKVTLRARCPREILARHRENVAGAFRAAGTRARERLSLPRRETSNNQFEGSGDRDGDRCTRGAVSGRLRDRRSWGEADGRGVARRSRRERTRIHGRKRQARDRGHGGRNHGGVISRWRDRRLTRQAVCGPHTAGGAGDPSERRALALAQSQHRQRRGDYADPHRQIARRNLLQGIPTHRDRRRAHRASPRQRLPPARRLVAGIELAPRPPWRPARRSNGGDRFNCPCTVQPFRPHPVALRRRERKLELKAGEGGCRRGCPRPVPHSRNPGDRNARPRKRNPRHPAVPT